MKKEAHQTLGNNIIPSHYELIFEPDLKTLTFKGIALININIQKPSNLIKLHAKELTIQKAGLLQKKEYYPAKIKIDEKNQELALTISKKIKGQAQLQIEFRGIHNDGMYGFYHSKYQEKGKTQYLLTTQFEAANARAAFPCFDEPAFKSTFDVSFIVDKDLFTLSNMPIKQETILPNQKKQVSFSTSPKMSTYLLYLGIGNFKSLETKSGSVTIRVLATPEKIHLGHLSLNYTKIFLRFFEEYFKIKYPLPKLDIIAIPDFASGAMENWGAITYREIALLGDENTSVVIKQNIAITVAHELAHQWFGNLVTMQWWDDLWLNESFATFMSYKAVHNAFPQWDLPLQYFEDTIADALNADEIESTHPISVHVNTPGEVDEIFDNISYDKGGSVLHMLENAVGETAFKKGLTNYLRKYAYKNATKHDLWKEIQDAKKETFVSTMVHGWITQPGYPLIFIKKNKSNSNNTKTHNSNNNNASSYQLTQERFSLLGKKHQERWIIPICYLTDENKAFTTILKRKSTTLFSKSSWIKLNYHQPGFFRVKYDSDSLTKIGSLILEKKISSLDSAGVENDLYSLTIALQYPLYDYLNFIEKYCLDAQYPLNASISGHLGWLYRITKNSDLENNVKKTSLLFHTQQFKKLGWKRNKEEKNTSTILRSMTLSNLALVGHQETLNQGKNVFAQIMAGKIDIDSNIKGVIYSIAAQQGDETIFNYFVKQYEAQTLPEEKRRLLRAIGMFQDNALKEKALAFSQSEKVRLQDSHMIPIIISANPGTNVLIWNWTRSNWKNLSHKYSSGTHMMGTFVHNLSLNYDAGIQKEIALFFKQKEHQRDDIKMAVRQVLERIEINRKFMEFNGQK